MINHLVLVPTLPDQTRHLVLLLPARGGDRLEGVLLQSKPDGSGRSKNPAFVLAAGGGK